MLLCTQRPTTSRIQSRYSHSLPHMLELVEFAPADRQSPHTPPAGHTAASDVPRSPIACKYIYEGQPLLLLNILINRQLPPLVAFRHCKYLMTDNNSRSRLQIAGDRLAAMASTLTGRPSHNFPAFDDLPKVEGQPQGCLWGHFDKKGQKKDEIGSKQSHTTNESCP